MTDDAPKTGQDPAEHLPANPPKIRRLSRTVEVRRLLARVIQELWCGEIAPKRAGQIIAGLNAAAGIIKFEGELAIARRIAALEARLLVGSAPARSSAPAARHFDA